MTYDVNLLVIGSGPAGEKAAAQAGYFGKSVAVIERAAQPGGVAVHTGTLPSKTLRESALFLAGHRQRELYGIDVTVERQMAVQRMLRRKDAVRDRETERVRWNLERHGARYVTGSARFLDGHTVVVQDGASATVVSGDYILVATGSIPHRPAEIDFDDPAIDDSDEILAIERLPESMIILGAGVIGCEYACMFAELGTAVTLVDARPRLLSFLDAEMGQALEAAMRRAGVVLLLGGAWSSVRREGNRIAVARADGADLVAERVLVASGRDGATEGLGLDDAGVRLGARGTIPVDREYRTNVPWIFAAGDVIGFPALASTAMEQGRVAVCHAFGFTYKQEMAATWPHGIFTIPEVSAVGATEEEAAATGVPYVCGRAAYELNARGQIIGAEGGLLKLIFDVVSRRLIGVHVIGEHATEIVHIGQAVMVLGGTVETLVDMVFNYPSLSECYKYAAYDALGRWASPVGASALQPESGPAGR